MFRQRQLGLASEEQRLTLDFEKWMNSAAGPGMEGNAARAQPHTNCDVPKRSSSQIPPQPMKNLERESISAEISWQDILGAMALLKLICR